MAAPAPFQVQQWLQQYRQQQQQHQVEMTKPDQVTCWTKAGGTFSFEDASGLPTYTRPSLPVDLNAGYPDAYTPKVEGVRSPVDTIVQATSAAVDFDSVDVCTYRNNLNKILLTPFGKDSWELDCCCHQGTLFLDIVQGSSASWPNAEKFTYYGYKFEAVCTGADHVDATSEFGIVVAYELGGLRVLMAAEIDAQQPGGELGPDGGLPYVEMKTYSIPRHAKASQQMYAEKHPRWWVQSYLAGVPTLVLGGRDQGGSLLKVQEVPVQALPGLSAHAGQPWDPNMLLAFGAAVLEWMKQQAAQHPGKQLRVKFDAASRSIQCEVVASFADDMPTRLQGLLPPQQQE